MIGYTDLYICRSKVEICSNYTESPHTQLLQYITDFNFLNAVYHVIVQEAVMTGPRAGLESSTASQWSSQTQADMASSSHPGTASH